MSFILPAVVIALILFPIALSHLAFWLGWREL